MQIFSIAQIFITYICIEQDFMYNTHTYIYISHLFLTYRYIYTHTLNITHAKSLTQITDAYKYVYMYIFTTNI